MSKSNGNGEGPRDVRISDGRVLTINLNALNWRDVREYVAGVPSFDPHEPHKTIEAERRHAELKGKTCGLTADEVMTLGYEDFTRLGRKISDLIVSPVETDDFLAKKSTSPETGESPSA